MSFASGVATLSKAPSARRHAVGDMSFALLSVNGCCVSHGFSDPVKKPLNEGKAKIARNFGVRSLLQCSVHMRVKIDLLEYYSLIINRLYTALNPQVQLLL